MTDNSAYPDSPIVLADDTVGVAIVERLLRDHETVLFLTPDVDAVESAIALGATAEVVDVTSGQALQAVAPDTDALGPTIVAAECDATALLICQLAMTKLGASTVIVLMDDPQNRVAFETAGMIPVCATAALADAVAATHSLVQLCGSELPPGQPAPTSTSNTSPPERPV